MSTGAGLVIRLFGIFDVRISADTFRNNNPADNIDQHERENNRENRGQDYYQPNYRRVDIEHFAQTAANAGDF
jgi:hypothetical protein